MPLSREHPAGQTCCTCFVVLPERGSKEAIAGRAEVHKGFSRQPREGLAGLKQRRSRPDRRAEGDGSRDGS